MTVFSAFARREGSARLATVRRLHRIAWLVDAIGRVPGTRFRFGINSIIGLPPVGGDVLLTLISLYIVFEAVRLWTATAEDRAHAA